MEKRKSDEFWFAEDGPVKDQPKERKHEENLPENNQEERVPLLDKVIHGYQAVAGAVSKKIYLMRNIDNKRLCEKYYKSSKAKEFRRRRKYF